MEHYITIKPGIFTSTVRAYFKGNRERSVVISLFLASRGVFIYANVRIERGMFVLAI